MRPEEIIANLKRDMGEAAARVAADARIVHGAACTWWDGIANVGHTKPGASGVTLPCCPHCGSVLFELPNSAAWFVGVDRYEADGHAGYRAFVEWLRGRCFPGLAEAKAAYERETGRTFS